MKSAVTTIAIAGALACGVAAEAGSPTLETVRVASGLNLPVYVTHAPGDENRIFVLEKTGVIRVIDLTTGVPSVFLNINSIVGGSSSTNDERGLLGLAFHPDYQTNGLFFVNYTNNSSDTVVAQYSVLGDPATSNTADASSAKSILFIDQPFTNHNGGWLAFGPNDGYLYVATGDGGASCDPGGRSLDITDQLLGKMLRIDINGDDFPADGIRNYAIPADNPFVGITGDDEIWAYGLRNPWRNAFDSATGDLYTADVGQFNFEEINFQAASSNGGENYGWDCKEGNSAPVPGCTFTACPGGLTDPIWVYNHNAGCSITGGEVYRGCAIPGLEGTYFYSDFCVSNIFSFEYNGTTITNFTNRTSSLSPSVGGFVINQITSFGLDARGEMYIVDQGSGSSGQIFRIREAGTDGSCPNLCTGDIVDTGSSAGAVDFDDLARLLGCWGPVVAGCETSDIVDAGGSAGIIDFDDLALLLGVWGPCP